MHAIVTFSGQLIAVSPFIELLGYVGPGLGAGALAIIIGLLASVALAVFAIFWYPIKRLLRSFRKGRDAPEESAPVDPT